MYSKPSKPWEDLLNPEILRPRLVAASIYIAVFEVFKEIIVDRIRDFYSMGCDDEDAAVNPRYQSAVLTRNRSRVYASLEWLKENLAIDDQDLRTFERVKSLRNALAHDLLSLLEKEGLPAEYQQCFLDMIELLRKIEVWWITNFEIPVSLEYDGIEVREDDINPGPVLAIQTLLDVALGDDERSRVYYDELQKSVASDEQNVT